jgi:curved DNA-binding protein CbpA
MPIRSFYALSKTHHPDVNPANPTASSERFVKISEAYAILSHAEKRMHYDREFLPRTQSSSSVSTTPRGSYSNSGPAGGRPPSGLSRRRTHFKGPPPSFYRNGGWGNQHAKRQAAHDETVHNSTAQGAHDHHGETAESAAANAARGGMGPGYTAWADMNNAPHFDREGHFRTHENIRSNNERRRQRPEHLIPDTPPSSMLANFLFVSAILSLGLFIPSYIFERMTRKGSPEKIK